MMQIPFRCSKQDYLDASAANTIWARLESEVNPLSRYVMQIGTFLLFGALAFAMITEGSWAKPDQIWSIAPRTLILALLPLPCLMLIMALQLAVNWRRSAPRSTGLIHRALPKASSRISVATLRGLIAWPVILSSLLFITWLEHRRPSLRGASGVAVPLGNARDASITQLLALTLVPVGLAFFLLSAIARKLKIKQYVQGQPQIFEDKSLEFDDEGSPSPPS